MKITTSLSCLGVVALSWLSRTNAYSSYSSTTSSSSSSYTYNGDAYGTNFFADSDISYYDGYQQAWRYLGWYVKCGAPSSRYDEQEHSHSGSQDNNNNQRYSGNNWCQRYLIWAAVRLNCVLLLFARKDDCCLFFFSHSFCQCFASSLSLFLSCVRFSMTSLPTYLPTYLLPY